MKLILFVPFMIGLMTVSVVRSSRPVSGQDVWALVIGYGIIALFLFLVYRSRERREKKFGQSFSFWLMAVGLSLICGGICALFVPAL